MMGGGELCLLDEKEKKKEEYEAAARERRETLDQGFCEDAAPSKHYYTLKTNSGSVCADSAESLQPNHGATHGNFCQADKDGVLYDGTMRSLGPGVML